MARRIGEDERATSALEVAVRHINRDSLLALGFQAIQEQSEVQRFARCAEPPRIARKRRDLIIGHRTRIEQQSADERRLSVIDGSARQDPKRWHQALGARTLRRRGHLHLRSSPLASYV